MSLSSVVMFHVQTIVPRNMLVLKMPNGAGGEATTPFPSTFSHSTISSDKTSHKTGQGAFWDSHKKICKEDRDDPFKTLVTGTANWFKNN